MKAWFRGGLIGGGIGSVIYIIFLIWSLFIPCDTCHPSLIVLALIPVILFRNLFNINEISSTVFVISIIVSGIIFISALTIIGIIIGWIVGKIKSRKQEI